MAASRYTVDIDLENVNDAGSLAILQVTPGATVLDLGGSVARAVEERGCRVVEDLEAAEEQVDFVLVLDVLERARDPLGLLRSAGERMKPTGKMIISVPNVTHAAVRLRLLTGRFVPGPRLFDRAGLERVIAEAGLTVLDRMRTTAGVDELSRSFPPDVLELALSGEDAETFEFVYVVSADGEAAEPHAVSLGEAFQRRIAELETELRDRAKQLERIRVELKHAKLDIALKEAQLAQVQAELAPVRARLDQAEELLGYARHRLVERLSASTKRMPVLHRGLKRIAERTGYRR